MSIFARPLVGLSLTETDAGLLRYARLVAGLTRCEEIRFAHAIPTETENPPSSTIEQIRERMQAEVTRHFGPFDGKVAFDVAPGPRLDRLLTLGVHHKHDVIVLGHSRARSGRRSLARRLAMTSPCSIWLVPEGSPAQISNVLVPVDFSKPSGDALSVGTSIAAARGAAQCLAVHVFFDPSTIRYDEHVAEVQGQEQAAFREFVEKVDRHGVQVEPIFNESAHPSAGILRVAHRHEIDLIVMSTRGRSRAAAVLLGSIASEVMAATPIPLLAVKHFGTLRTLPDVLFDRESWHTPSVKTN